MDSVVEKIHASPLRCAIIATGAGATSISALTSVAGCSRTLIDAQVPYCASVSAALLDNFPERHLSPTVGTELAQHAYARCKEMYQAEFGGPVNISSHHHSQQQNSNNSNSVSFAGIGCTAAVRTDRTRRGEDGAYITCWHDRCVENFRIRFSKSERREQQEKTTGAVIIFALARCCIGGVDQKEKEKEAASSQNNNNNAKLLEQLGIKRVEFFSSENFNIEKQEDDVVYIETLPHAADPFLLLIRKQVDRVLFNLHGIPRHNMKPHTEEFVNHDKAIHLLFPGSFCPLHWGHTELARVASAVVSRRDEEKQQQHQHQHHHKKKKVVVTYEISATIVGKRELRESDLSSRVAQFTGRDNINNSRVAVTRAKLFVDKARMFPGHGLIVGIDTAERVIDPRYYGNSVEKLHAALNEIRSHGCYFVVGGRLKQSGESPVSSRQASFSASDAAASSSGAPPPAPPLPSAGAATSHPSMMMPRQDSSSGGAIGEDHRWFDCSNLIIPSGFEDMFIGLRHEDFRVDISSTEIRARRGDVKEMKLYVDVERIYNELRELGLGPTDALTVEQLLPFDQYHYFGTQTVDEGAVRAKITASTRVLDVGSGLGGPSRYLAKNFGCKVTAVELQKDVNDVAQDLTVRCGLGQMIEHRSADFMADDGGDNDDESGAGECSSGVGYRGQQYDVIVSWLVFVHITDRATLLKRCFDALKPGGRLFVEDFHKIGEFTDEEDRMLNQDVHCGYLPTLEEFRSQCLAAGFDKNTLELVDFTKEAVVFAKDRHQQYADKLERHVRVHGVETAHGMLHFYKVISTLFSNGRFGLCRVLATKPL